MYAKKLLGHDQWGDLIIGNNVLARNPDLQDFIGGLRDGLANATASASHQSCLIFHGERDD